VAKERYLNTKFWDDNYIVKLDPIEKLLFVYFLTNPLANLIGVYEISLRRIAFDTGVEEEIIENILKRFDDVDKIKYKNGYIVIKNFTKYQKNNPKINKGIQILLDEIPEEFIDWINIDLDRLYIGYDNLSHLNSYSNPNSNPNTNNILSCSKKIIEYLNQKTGKNFKDTTTKTKAFIKARISEGYTLDDFKTVIDKKTAKWLNDPKMSDYLRPETLFGTKFESYLNEKIDMEAIAIEEARKCYYKNIDECEVKFSDRDLSQKCRICLKRRYQWKK